MKSLALICLLTFAATLASAQTTTQLYVHPRTYITQKSFYLFRQLSDSLTSPIIRVDSGQVIIASEAFGGWAFINNCRLSCPLPAVLSSLSQLTPISPTDNITFTLFARRAGMVLVPYKDPIVPSKHRKRHSQ